MRTLVCIGDIQQEVEAPVHCPRCGPGSAILLLLDCHLQMNSKGGVVVNKKAYCETHGHLSFSKNIKAVQMHGTDAQVIPRYDK